MEKYKGPLKTIPTELYNEFILNGNIPIYYTFRN